MIHTLINKNLSLNTINTLSFCKNSYKLINKSTPIYYDNYVRRVLHDTIINKFDLSLRSYYETNIIATLTAGVLVGLVLAIGRAVAKEILLDTLAVSARQLSLRANGFVGLEDGQNFTRLCKKRNYPLNSSHLQISYRLSNVFRNSLNINRMTNKTSDGATKHALYFQIDDQCDLITYHQSYYRQIFKYNFIEAQSSLSRIA